MFHIIEMPENPTGYVKVSTSAELEAWLRYCLPGGIDKEVQRRLVSNLKHVIVGLELKAALVVPHAKRGAGPSILFESYFHIMNFEFCVGVFSVCEGLGSALWLQENNLDGSAADRVSQQQWKPSLVKKFDPMGQFDLGADADRVKNVRDKLHQDRLGARANIDWHVFSYHDAFVPAARVMRRLLQINAEHVPKHTNLTVEQA